MARSGGSFEPLGLYITLPPSLTKLYKITWANYSKLTCSLARLHFTYL